MKNDAKIKKWFPGKGQTTVASERSNTASYEEETNIVTIKIYVKTSEIVKVLSQTPKIHCSNNLKVMLHR